MTYDLLCLETANAPLILFSSSVCDSFLSSVSPRLTVCELVLLFDIFLLSIEPPFALIADERRQTGHWRGVSKHRLLLPTLHLHYALVSFSSRYSTSHPPPLIPLGVFFQSPPPLLSFPRIFCWSLMQTRVRNVGLPLLVSLFSPIVSFSKQLLR